MAELTAEQRRYFDDYDEMFATNGWKQLLEEANVQLDNLRNECLVTPEKAVALAGEGRMLTYLLNLEQTLDNQRRMLQEDFNAPV